MNEDQYDWTDEVLYPVHERPEPTPYESRPRFMLARDLLILSALFVPFALAWGLS